jgi:hypothetical protein
MGKLQFSYHPVIDNLQVNEDGSIVKWKNRKLPIKTYEIGVAKVLTKRVHVDCKIINLNKLIVECWHGMRPDREQCARMIDATKGTHYTNLEWAKIGGGGKEVHRYVKIPVEELPKIEQRLNNGESLMSIAKDYGVSDMTICRIKKKYVVNV